MPTSVPSLSPLDPAALLVPEAAARHVLGSMIRRTLPDGQVLMARIVEVECYFQTDPASHTYRGESKRNTAMFGPPGYAYIYLSYGVHWCLNVTAGPLGHGAGVLIRAVEPREGIERMRQLRGLPGGPDRLIGNGPGKLAKALAIDSALYGHDLSLEPLQVLGGGSVPAGEVVATPRIGISVAQDALLRFCLKGSDHLSRRVVRRVPDAAK